MLSLAGRQPSPIMGWPQMCEILDNGLVPADLTRESSEGILLNHFILQKMG